MLLVLLLPPLPRRYAKEPLIVRGPGAGNEVTAAGVLGDVLHITRCSSSF